MPHILERHSNFALRLPTSLREKAYTCAQEEGVSLNQFIITALTERLTRMEMNTAAKSEKDIQTVYTPT